MPDKGGAKVGAGPAPRRLVVIHNPAAGQRHRRRAAATLARLNQAGCILDLRATEGPGHAEAIAATLSHADADMVVAAGGDGTVNEVLNGLAGADHAVPPLALLPLGTANVLAAEIGMRLRPAAIAETILVGRPRRIHLGRVNGRHFALMVGVGLDAQAVAGVDLALKRHLGKLAYVAAALAQTWRYPFPVCDVTVDGHSFAACSALVCNGRLYAGRFVAAANACLERPGFEVVLMERPGIWNALRYGAALATGRLAALPDVRIVSGSRVSISGTAGAPVQADGDVVAALPAEIDVAARGIDVVYPPSASA